MPRLAESWQRFADRVQRVTHQPQKHVVELSLSELDDLGVSHANFYRFVAGFEVSINQNLGFGFLPQ